MKYCYLNGQVLSEEDARISILDIGLLRGFGIYEAMAAHNGTIFRYDDHITRFQKSAAFLRIDMPHTTDEIQQIILNLVEKNGLAHRRVNIKCILTGGHAHNGIEYTGTTPTFYVFIEEWKALDASYYSAGAHLMTHEHLRQYPQYKTTNYITAVLLQKEMKGSGALEILYVWKNEVLECATSNFFIIKNGTLITARENILTGVTRNVVIELATKAGYPVEERVYTQDELWNADECFLTSSFKDVVPVVTIDTHTIADGSVGHHTKKVMGLFQDYFLQTNN